MKSYHTILYHINYIISNEIKPYLLQTKSYQIISYIMVDWFTILRINLNNGTPFRSLWSYKPQQICTAHSSTLYLLHQELGKRISRMNRKVLSREMRRLSLWFDESQSRWDEENEKLLRRRRRRRRERGVSLFISISMFLPFSFSLSHTQTLSLIYSFALSLFHSSP